MKFLIISFSLLIIISCNSDIDSFYVKSKTWSYNGGFKIGKGDFILFDKGNGIFDLKGDTIYYEGKSRAIIESINKKIFIMKVRSIDGKKTGTYRNLEESLK